MTTMMLREHNRIATELAQVNPRCDDETLYQEARRILIAQWQHLVYAEYLPILLGHEYVQKMNLTPSNSGQSSEYRPELNPNTINSWGVGAFRSFHSTVPGINLMVDAGRCPFSEFYLRNWFRHPSIIEEPGAYDGLLRGATSQSQQTQDRHLTDDVTDYLFKKPAEQFGGDLEAIDIQRGRDHGVPPYNEYRVLCGLPRAQNFADFSDTMAQKDIALLEQHYESVDDVDLIVGGTLETLLPGTLVGPTFQWLNGEQFRRWKYADRWFYQYTGNNHPFSDEQLAEIKKGTLSRIICDNGDDIVQMQRNSFLMITAENPLVPCDEIPRVNLRLWTENP